jgi:hypothetical protein
MHTPKHWNAIIVINFSKKLETGDFSSKVALNVNMHEKECFKMMNTCSGHWWQHIREELQAPVFFAFPGEPEAERKNSSTKEDPAKICQESVFRWTFWSWSHSNYLKSTWTNQPQWLFSTWGYLRLLSMPSRIKEKLPPESPLVRLDWSGMSGFRDDLPGGPLPLGMPSYNPTMAVQKHGATISYLLMDVKDGVTCSL